MDDESVDDVRDELRSGWGGESRSMNKYQINYTLNSNFWTEQQ